MIVPGTRLLFWMAALLPFAVMGGLVPGTAWIAVLLYAGLLVLASADASMGRRRAASLRVEVPDIVRMSRDREGEIPVRIENRTAWPMLVRVGLPLPDAFRSELDALDVSLPAGSELSAAAWPCVPVSRGRYRIRRCYFQTPSPFGFWQAKGSSACDAEVRVYPDLGKEKKRLAAFFLNRGNFGLHTQRMVGQGRDFEKLREYIPGDSYDDIHWKATAKRGKPVTKLYQVERTQEIYVVIDSSRLSARVTGTEPAIERFISAALVLGLAAEQQGDLFGLLAFSDHIHRFIRAGGGRAHFNACREALHTVTAETVAPAYDELATFVRTRMRRRSLLLLLTDLGDPVLAESFLRNIDLFCRQHLVMVCMLKQPGIGPLFAGPDPESVDDIYGRLAGHMVWHKLNELRKSLNHRGIHLSFVEEEKLSVELVTRYINVKARQQL